MNYIKILLLLFFILNSCMGAIKEISPSKDLKEKLKLLKRVNNFLITEPKLTTMEMNLLEDILNDQTSNHTEFIIYAKKNKLEAECKNLDQKINGFFRLIVNQKETEKNLHLIMQLDLIECPTNIVVWKTIAVEKYPKTLKENEGLRNAYIEKYGMGIDSRINPYYYLIKEMVEIVVSPELNESEKEEKIEASI
jgi:probable lipoprotein (TIGR04455 family)